MLTQESFHSQFQLNLDQYRDNNNFIRMNKMTTNDNRLTVWKPSKVQYFLDYTMGPIWIGQSMYNSTNTISWDGGETYNEEHRSILFGAFFFFSNDKVEH